MDSSERYYLVREKAVPEVLLKVIEAKRLLDSEKVMTVQEATAMVDISRSSFYKYKDDIFPFHESNRGKTINIMMQLESGAVDAVVCDLSIAARQMAAKPDVFKQVQTLSDEEYAVGFKKGNTQMIDAVNATLKEMTADGTVEKILKNYEDQAVSMENWLIK